jgi:chlorite dismutase
MQPTQPFKRQFVNFIFYKVDPSWRRLPEAQRRDGRAEFLAAARGFESKMMVLPYSTFGLRPDADFALWRISYVLEDFEAMSAAMAKTALGSHLSTPHSFLAMTKRSTYVDKLNPEHENLRTHIVPGKHKYLFIYPFLKTREWYLLPLETRQKMMDDHIRVGNKFPSVKLNTTYSFGLDDQEFVVAFETDAPGDFLDLVMALRETEGSRFTLRDTPIFTALHRPLDQLLDTVA